MARRPTQWPDSCIKEGVRRVGQLGQLGRVAIGVAVAGSCVIPAGAAKNSSPAQVMMVATMPATFTLQAAQATITGASGTVQIKEAGRGRLLIRGRVSGQGGRALVSIPLSLAANTRSFVVQAEGASGEASVYLSSPGLIARIMPMRSHAAFAMATARDHGREYFALNQPLHSTLEIVFADLGRGQARDFMLALSMRDLGY